MDLVPGNNPDPWGLLHDGSLVGIERIGPIVRATLKCQYIRERFHDRGDRFVFELLNCTHVEVTPSDEAPITDLGIISQSDWGIFNAEEADARMQVYLDEGKLELEYSSLTIHVDSGRLVPLEELIRHVQEYWDGFGKRS